MTGPPAAKGDLLMEDHQRGDGTEADRGKNELPYRRMEIWLQANERVPAGPHASRVHISAVRARCSPGRVSGSYQPKPASPT